MEWLVLKGERIENLGDFLLRSCLNKRMDHLVAFILEKRRVRVGAMVFDGNQRPSVCVVPGQELGRHKGLGGSSRGWGRGFGKGCWLCGFLPPALSSPEALGKE